MSGQARERPLATFGLQPAVVSSVSRIGAYGEFKVEDPSGGESLPGQFHMISAERDWGGDGSGRPFLPRALSHLASADGMLSFLVHDVGPGTERFMRLEAGERVRILGPLGNGFSEPDSGVRPILVGGGIGVAPILALSDRLSRNSVEHDLILGFRSKEFAEPFSERASARICTDDGSIGERGTVIAPLEEMVVSGTEIFACGPPAMLDGIGHLANDRGIVAQLALETPMACGWGSCFGCVVPTKNGYQRACVDGPVFRAGDLVDKPPSGQA